MIQEKIEIPFGAYDSELKGWEYTIPEGMEAVIENGKVIVRQRESEDERIRKDIISHFESIKALALYGNQEESEDIVSLCNKKIAWLEKQKEQKTVEWSEDDTKEHIDAICQALVDNEDRIGFYTVDALCSWLRKKFNYNYDK